MKNKKILISYIFCSILCLNITVAAMRHKTNDEVERNNKNEEQEINIISTKNFNTLFTTNHSLFDELYKIKYSLETKIIDMKNAFIDYKNSIFDKSNPIDKIIENYIIFEKKNKDIEKLIKKFDNIKTNYLSKIEEKKSSECIDEKTEKLISEIKQIIEDYLLEISQSERLIYYSFLGRYKQLKKDALNTDIATYHDSINVLDDKFKYPKGAIKIEERLKEEEQKTNLIKTNNNFDELINSNITNLNTKYNTFNILDEELKQNKFNYEKSNSDVNKLKDFTKEILNLYNKTCDAFFKSLKDIKDEYNRENFHTLSKELINFYDKNKEFLNYKNKNINKFKNTLKELENIKEKTLIKQFKIREMTINSLLKESIYEFFNCCNKYDKIKTKIKNNKKDMIQKNNINEFEPDIQNNKEDTIQKNNINKFEPKIKNNKKDIIPKNNIKKFETLWNEIKNRCYYFETYNAYVDRNQKNLHKLYKEKRILENYTLLLKAIGEQPFINSLIEEIKKETNNDVNNNIENNAKNNNQEEKNFDSLLFKSKINSYKAKLNMIYEEYENDLNFLSDNKNLEKEKIFKDCKTWISDVNKFSEKCYTLLSKIKKQIKNNKNSKIKIYGKHSLKKRINSFKTFIENIRNIVRETTNEIIEELKNNNIEQYDKNIELNNKKEKKDIKIIVTKRVKKVIKNLNKKFDDNFSSVKKENSIRNENDTSGKKFKNNINNYSMDNSYEEVSNDINNINNFLNKVKEEDKNSNSNSNSKENNNNESKSNNEEKNSEQDNINKKLEIKFKEEIEENDNKSNNNINNKENSKEKKIEEENDNKSNNEEEEIEENDNKSNTNINNKEDSKEKKIKEENDNKSNNEEEEEEEEIEEEEED